eukprot:545556_1
MQGIHKDKSLPNIYVTEQYAFSSLSIESICNGWDIMKHESAKYGYDIWNNIQCNISKEVTPFPIDIVYLFSGETISSGQRLRYNGDLRYSIRSIYMFALWVNKIWIIISNDTYSGYPSWIDKQKVNSKYSLIPIEMVYHSDIVYDKSNAINNHDSQSIESCVHHINNLSNHYIYLNDDFLLSKRVSWDYWFNLNGTIRYPKKYYDYYNNYKTTYQRVYPNNKKYKFDIPFRTARLFVEHMPRAFTRSSWYLLEERYNEWFKFVESHKKRYCPSYVTQTGCFNEDMYLIMMGFRLLYKEYYHILKKEFNDSDIKLNLFDIQIMDYSNVHLWLTGNKNFNVGNLRVFINKIETIKPNSFCMNDVFDVNIHSDLYKAEIRFIHRFYQRFYPYNNIIKSYEKENIIEPSLQSYLKDLNNIIYNDFGWDIDKGVKETNLSFIFIPRNIGDIIENFGFSHRVLWGQYQNYENKFMCKTDDISRGGLLIKKPKRICCHRRSLPTRYLKTELELNIKKSFCIIRHPFERIISQYHFRLHKENYEMEEISLMNKFANITNRIEKNKNKPWDWCDVKVFNLWIIASLLNYLSFPSVRDCHFMSQSEYVFDVNLDGKLCDHVLYWNNNKHNNFTSEFDSLMIENNIINSNESTKQYFNNVNEVRKCKNIKNVDQISDFSKNLIYKVYQRDFEMFQFDI